MRGDTEFEVDNRTLTWDELDCLLHVSENGYIPKGLGGKLLDSVIDSLESKGVLTEVSAEHYEWASQQENWFDTNSVEIKAIIDAERTG